MIDEILERDQRYRKTPELISAYFFTLDSLLKEEGYHSGIDTLTYLSSEKQSMFRDNARTIAANRPKPNQIIVDSLWQLQKAIDYDNSLQVLDIIDRIGVPALFSLTGDCGSMALIVFIHTPDDLKERVKAVIQSNEENISQGQYNHIMWHLEGRKSRG